MLFFLKKGKRCNVKSLPIYVRITIDGERAEWSIQRSCEPGSEWNQTIERATGTKEDAKIINVYLDAIIEPKTFNYKVIFVCLKVIFESIPVLNRNDHLLRVKFTFPNKDYI